MAVSSKSRLKRAGAGVTVVGALAIATVALFEGVTTKAIIPIPGDVPTICFGETRGVKMGDTATLAQCKAMLGDALVTFESGMRACLTSPDNIPDKRYVAYLSLSYNIGTRAFCGSTVARKANAGDARGSCDAFLAWNKASSRVVPGLTTRRQQERALCLSGL